MRKVAIAAILAAAASIMLAQPASGQIPDWVRTTTSHWVDGSITDMEFLNMLSALISADIIQVKPIIADTITIGLIPVEKADDLLEGAAALETYLEGELQTDIEIVIPSDYETIIEGLKFGHIDAAFMDTGPGWIAHHRAGAEVIMAEVKKNGEIKYEATIWVRADNTDVNSIEDTLGKKVAFTSITGSSGFIRPFGTLISEGHITVNGDDVIALEEAIDAAFEQHTFSGGYSQALALLVAGKVDVAFGSDIAPQLYLEPGQQGLIRAAATLGPVPSHVLVASDEMSHDTREALLDAMIGLNYDGNNQILRDLYGAQALLPTTTTMHIGDFGDVINALPGLDQLILDKKNFS